MNGFLETLIKSLKYAPNVKAHIGIPNVRPKPLLNKERFKMDVNEQADELADFPQRMTNLEKLVKQMQEQVFKLEMQCAPLYSMDIDLLFREFWSLRLKYCHRVYLDILDGKYKESKDIIYIDAARHITNLMHKAIGKMTLADDPLEVGRNWYKDAQKYIEKLGITDIFTDSPETLFPKSKPQNEI
jgi:hypothetical protein